MVKKKISEQKKFNSKQVQAMYQVSAATLCEWRKEKKGPAYFQPTPGRILYLEQDLEQYFGRNHHNTHNK